MSIPHLFQILKVTIDRLQIGGTTLRFSRRNQKAGRQDRNVRKLFCHFFHSLRQATVIVTLTPPETVNIRTGGEFPIEFRPVRRKERQNNQYPAFRRNFPEGRQEIPKRCHCRINMKGSSPSLIHHLFKSKGQYHTPKFRELPLCKIARPVDFAVRIQQRIERLPGSRQT